MYSLQCTVGVHASSARHSTALGSCKDCSAIFLHSGHVTTCIDRSRQKEAALYKVCCSLSATQESNVQPAAVLYRGNYLGAKADLLRVLWKGDITHAWNPERASNQIRSVQIKAKQWTHGTGFEKMWKFGGSLGYRIRYHIQHFLSNSLKRCAGVQMWGGQTRGRKVDAGEEEEQRKGSWAETAANASFIPTVIIFGTYIWNVMSKENTFITRHKIRMLGLINVVSNWVNDGRGSFKEQL